MTGHQDHPGTGKTLMGDDTYTALPEDFARACGIKNVKVIDPLDLKRTLEVIREEIKKDSPSVIISRRPCALIEKKRKSALFIDPGACTDCGRCLRVGCPAIYKKDDKILIDSILCNGCGFCAQVCPQGAIKPVQKN